MIYLLLSILSSTCIFLIFKILGKYKINTLLAIITNYIVACLCGLYSYNAKIEVSEIIASKWFYGALILGFLFISIFNVMAITAQKNGITVASVASKMSVVIPIIFGIYAYNESTGLQKIIGILLALFAVYLASVKTRTLSNLERNLSYPFLLFIGSGIIDTSIKYIETTYVPENGIPIFSATIFFFAAIIGGCVILYKIFTKQFKFEIKSIFGGILLGIVNYGSIYYLLKALHFEGSESSTIFTVNNVAIVMLSTLLGLVFFKEHISKTNWLGIAFAIISIVLVTLA